MEKRQCSDGVILVSDPEEVRMLYATHAITNRSNNGGNAETWATNHGGPRLDYPATIVRTAFVFDQEILDLFRRRIQDDSDVALVPDPAS